MNNDNLQIRLAIQNSAIQWANSMMQEGIPAYMVVDALSATLGQLRDISLQQILQLEETVNSLSQQQQQEDDSAAPQEKEADKKEA